MSASFFTLGGHSLSVGRLVNLIRRDLNISITIADVYSTPSVQKLAELADRHAQQAAEKQAAQGERKKEASPDGFPPDRYPSSFQQRSLHQMANVSAAASAALNVAFCCHVRALAATPTTCQV